MNLLEYSDILRAWLASKGMSSSWLSFFHLLVGLCILAVACVFVWAVTRFIIIRAVRKLVTKTEATWDDRLFEHRVFRSLALIVISMLVAQAIPILSRDYPNWSGLLIKASKIYIVLSVMFAINAVLNALVAILEDLNDLKDKPLRSYKQVTKIVFYLVGMVLILAILLGQSPLYILGGFGAVTAVFILIFRDPILGFVASIQMSAVDLVRIGDWITVDKYGADGEVFEINLTTVKVRNWDMTVTIVPSYALISESFRNWRGMQESEGRRIKRHVNIKISSIRFCDENMFKHLLDIELIRSFLLERQAEINQYNADFEVDKSVLVNGRHMTNVGIFRMYVEAFLSKNPNINKNMTFMVRQLQATESGLPIEVYAFSLQKDLEAFEAVAADIFDHLLAAVPYFDLEIFQSPSGSDMRTLNQRDEKKSEWDEKM